VFANRHADRLKVRVHDGGGMWLGTRRLQAAGFAWPVVDAAHAAGSMTLTAEQVEWLVAGSPWQRLTRSAPQPMTVI
jgi:transposase